MYCIYMTEYSYFAEFFGTLFLLYVIIATGNPFAIGAALVVATMTTGQIWWTF